jgi:hypothetical protein
MDEIEDFQCRDSIIEIKNAATAAMKKLKKYYKKMDASFYAVALGMYFYINYNYNFYILIIF